jgi:hypothetical protein
MSLKDISWPGIISGRKVANFWPRNILRNNFRGKIKPRSKFSKFLKNQIRFKYTRYSVL